MEERGGEKSKRKGRGKGGDRKKGKVVGEGIEKVEKWDGE